MKLIWNNLARLLHFVAVRFSRGRCAANAANLTLITLLSLVPLVTVASTLFSITPLFAEFASNIKQFLLATTLPETGSTTITHYITQFTESASRLTTAGILFLGATSMLLMHTVEDTLNTLWRVTHPRPLGRRILIYVTTLILMPIMVGGSLTLTFWLINLSLNYTHEIPELKFALLKITPILVNTLAFSLLFRIVPNHHVPMRHAFIGGIVAAIAYEATNHAFSYYIAHVSTYKLLYGAFAGLPALLMCIYFAWLSVLVGAVLTASLPYWRGEPTNDPSSALRLYYAVRTLDLMHTRMDNGQAPTLRQLALHLRIGFDTLAYLLEELSRAHIARKFHHNQWELARPPADIPLAELYRLFVFDPVVLPASLDDPRITRWFDDLGKRLGARVVTLEDLFTPT
jgi:membrane protein